MAKFNELQKEVAEIYASGDLSYVERPSELPDCGDSLFAFCMYEASDAEDIEVYVGRLETAINDLQTLRDHFAQRLLEQES